MPKPLRIVEQNPQRAPEAIPGYRSQVKFNPNSRIQSQFQTMAVTRALPTSGEVLIVDEGRPGAAASNFTLAAPARQGFEAGIDGSRLEIISTCRFKHVVRTPANAINGCANTLTFDGLGAVSLYAHNGVWIVTSAAGVKITNAA